jgi:hypothetical protein
MVVGLGGGGIGFGALSSLLDFGHAEHDWGLTGGCVVRPPPPPETNTLLLVYVSAFVFMHTWTIQPTAWFAAVASFVGLCGLER